MSRKTDTEAQYKRLRSYLSPAIAGPNTDAVLYSLAEGSAVPLVNLVEAIHDQVYIISASGKYLDEKLAEYGITRPSELGLSDELYRQIGISIINEAQIRELILKLLSIMFGEDATHATASATTVEPYDLSNQDDLIIKFDGGQNVSVVFDDSQFTNIHNASAQEVADAITKSLRQQGKTGSAYIQNDGLGNYVIVMSDTVGPSSSVVVEGGLAQKVLRFKEPRATTADNTTSWTVQTSASGTVVYTWAGGNTPSIGKVKENDYVIISDPVFNVANRGTFKVVKVVDGVAGAAYFEVENSLGVNQGSPVTQTLNDGVLFFNPFKNTIATKNRFAALYQSQANLLEIIIPATTKVVRRSRIGSAHIHDMSDPNDPGPLAPGPYIYDRSQGFQLLKPATTLATAIDGTIGQILPVTSSEDFPDSPGFIVLGYGTSHQEGPIPYLNRPSNDSILISPSYVIQKSHPVGTDVAQVKKEPVKVATDGSDYDFIVTGTATGRIYAQDLINLVAATGMNLVFTVIYPGTVGLAKNSEEYIWG